MTFYLLYNFAIIVSIVNFGVFNQNYPPWEGDAMVVTDTILWVSECEVYRCDVVHNALANFTGVMPLTGQRCPEPALGCAKLG